MPQANDRKTQLTGEPVQAYLATVHDQQRRADAIDVINLMREVTGVEPEMWGAHMVGFGRLGYTTADKVTRETMTVGLAARKAALVVYGLRFGESWDDLLSELGPHSTGKGCLYLKRFAEVDRDVLATLIERAWAAATSE